MKKGRTDWISMTPEPRVPSEANASANTLNEVTVSLRLNEIVAIPEALVLTPAFQYTVSVKSARDPSVQSGRSVCAYSRMLEKFATASLRAKPLGKGAAGASP